MKKLFILFVKYMPISQLMGIFVVNILYSLNILPILYHIFNYLFGNSIIIILLLFIANKLFGFCKWHRICIYGNFVNITITTYDKIFTIPISNLEILVLYSTISIVFLFIALYYKFKLKKDEITIESINKRIESCCG